MNFGVVNKNLEYLLYRNFCERLVTKQSNTELSLGEMSRMNSSGVDCVIGCISFSFAVISGSNFSDTYKIVFWSNVEQK